MAGTVIGRWSTYARERFPVVSYVLLSGGVALSSVRVAPGGDAWPVGPLAIAFVGVVLFFFTLRLMDELKDYEKDVVAHPERPLPRGLLGREEVARVVLLLVAAMAALSLAAGWAYALVTVYLWLMYKEFYAGAWLSRYPLAYAVSHQVILLPLCVFGALLVSPRALSEPAVQGYAVAVLGSFFTYEVCRKLDPRAHPVLGTYLATYGVAGSFAIVAVTTTVAALGAARLGVLPWLLPVALAVPLAFLVLFRRPDRFKLVEGVATASLIVHLNAGVLAAAS